MSTWAWLLVASLLASGFFSGSETALVSGSRLRQRAARERGRALAGLAERLYRWPRSALIVLLLGTNLANILASVCGLMLTEGGLQALGLALPAFWSDLLSSLWISALVLVGGEILPKSVGRFYALRITRWTAPFLLTLVSILRPLLWVSDGLGRLLRFLFRPGVGRRRDGISWETVKLHLETGRAVGVVDEQEDVLIRRIALLKRLRAESLMIPLARLSLYPVTGSVEGLRRHLIESRAPWSFLYDGERERLVGLVSACRLLGLDESTELRSLAGKLRRVPTQRSLLDLIDELQLTQSKFAVVTDPEGRCLGAVFLNDLLRELVLFRNSGDEKGIPSIHSR